VNDANALLAVPASIVDSLTSYTRDPGNLYGFRQQVAEKVLQGIALDGAIVCGDLDEDGDVDADDFDIFLASFGHSEGDPDYNPQADCDNDGSVTTTDYEIWLQHYRNYIGDQEAPAPLEVLDDFQQDGYVDHLDFAHLLACMTGTMVLQETPDCQDADLDNDDDVDLSDFGLFQRCLSGAYQKLDLSCKY